MAGGQGHKGIRRRGGWRTGDKLMGASGWGEEDRECVRTTKIEDGDRGGGR